MGWSLGYLKPSEPVLINAILLSAGKALYLSNHFEHKCQDLLQFFKLGTFFEKNPNASWDDRIVVLSNRKLLGPTIKELKKFPIVSSEIIVSLEKARDARNFIAHEGAAIGGIYYVRKKCLLEHLDKLRNAVVDLTNGDNIVSRWVYEIEEKEPAPQGIQDEYPEMVEKFVFGHIKKF